MKTLKGTVTIFGGTGFIGHSLVQRLCHEGYRVKTVSLNPEHSAPLKVCGPVGKIINVYGNITNQDDVNRHVHGSDMVINLVGILSARGKERFSRVHAKGPEYIAQAVKKYHIKRLIHVSALGIDKPSGSLYARSKYSGEKAVINAFEDTTIIRPSVIFGPNDQFFNMLAKLSRFSPFLPLINGGKTKMQPVYIEDVTSAILECLQNDKTKGNVYELGGPNILTMKDIMQYTLKITHRTRILLPIPDILANIIGFFMEQLPSPLLTRDQVKLLKVHNVVGRNALNLTHLGITPTPLESIVPRYL